MGRRIRVVLGTPLITLGIPIVALVVTLALNPAARAHPHLSRGAVIAAALNGYDRHEFSRVEAKLMYRHDLERADPELGHTNHDDLIWVVAVSGNYGISPSFGCCSVPSDYPGHNTWGVAIIVDEPGPPQPNEFDVSYHGDWPPFFDGLPDLAAGN
jgi:hypothetical protein